MARNIEPPSHRGTEPLAAIDAVWLRMDRETNPMVIGAMLVLDGTPSRSALLALLRKRLLPHGRFRQRAVEGVLGVGGRWEEDPLFDLDAHVHEVALPPPGDEAALAALVGDLLSTPLDRRRPLWQVHLVDGCAGGSVLVVRIHHAVADGVALVRVLLDLTEEGEGALPATIGRPPARPRRGLLAHLRHRAIDLWTLGRLLALSSDPRSPLRAPLGTRRRVAWSSAVPLARVRDVARSQAATVHDVLAAGVAGALRTACVAAGHTPMRHLRAVVPFYLSPEGAPDAGNHFGLVFLPLPVAEAEPRGRIARVKAEMDRVKASHEAEVALGVLAVLGASHPEIERIGVEVFSRKASVMLTDVAGPREVVHVAGAKVSSLVVWAPTSGRIGVGLSLLSYRGEVRLGVVADAHALVEPAAIAGAFEREVLVPAPREPEEVASDCGSLGEGPTTHPSL